jgi:transposase
LRLKGEQMKDIKINIATKSNDYQVDNTQKLADHVMTKEQFQALMQGKIERAQKHIKAMEHIKSIN